MTIEITFKDGHTEVFPNLTEASNACGISESALKIRANKSRQGSINKKDKIGAKWIDDTTFRSFSAKRSKHKGSNWEYELRDKFIELGYTDCVTSRGESKNLDNSKVDIASDMLPFYCQAKNTANTPNYFGISNLCPLKDKPFVVCWKKADEQNKAVAIVPIEYFYELLRK